ncbi:unnamed protein product [Trichobilharzia regenti]|uniref:PHTB1_N domain-containing protein n=1 Tax=Trichobilharzia regenti TaxID=157069 RepID=A0A183W6R8_TRIRE|nr:unnamed protein product [Trichobilharzia regenti]VDQ03811.1 unnamed protein product [Trichobilharzia regenti]
MSLFKLRDIWSTQVNRNSDEDEFCLKLSPLHNLNKSQYFILVGTFSGILSIFLPRARECATAADGDDLFCQSQHCEDLCLEYHVEHPILSIDCGHLVTESDSQYQQIVILHPQMLSVYTLTKSDSSAADEDTKYPVTFSFDSWKLTSLINLRIEKPSFHMFIGKFIEHIQTDVICVQMIDASFCFYNLSGVLFNIALSSMLIIPGPVVFLQSNCTMLTSASRSVYCFSFTPSSVDDTSYMSCDINNNNNSKNILLNWSIVLEEPIFSMEKIEAPSNRGRHFPISYIIVLGRRRIILLSETGCILFSRQIDIPPRHLCIYGYAEVDSLTSHENPSVNNSNNNVRSIPTWKPRFLITTEKNQLLVFKGIEILWSALLPIGSLHCSIPISPLDSFKCGGNTLPTVGVNFPPGLIVLLNSNSRLTLSYLGTDPSESVVPNILKTIPHKNGNNSIQDQLTNENFNKEMNQLNERINNLLKTSQSSSALLSSNIQHKDNQVESTSVPKLKANIRLPSESINNDQICFIDIIIEFPKKYSRKQFTYVHLLTYSCPPVVINPNYIEISNPRKNHDFVLMNQMPNSHRHLYTITCNIGDIDHTNNNNDDDNDEADEYARRSFQPPLDMVVILMLYYTFTYTKTDHNGNNTNNNDSISVSGDTSSVSTHSISKCLKRCIKIPLNLCTTSNIVDKRQVEGRFSLYFQLLTKFNNNKDSKNIHLPNLFPNLWSKLYTTDLNDSSNVKSKKNNTVMRVSFCGFKNPVKLDYCAYISLNCKKSLLKLQSNYSEIFWPILQELIYYNTFTKKPKNDCLNGGSNFFSDNDYLHIVLYKKNSPEGMNKHRIPERSSLLVFNEYAAQIEPLFNQLSVNLEDHINKRVELVQAIVKLTVHSKHFHTVQGEVMNRIKNSLPNCLNGFDLLLKRDLTNLLNICDLLEHLTGEHFQSGISVISLIVLLSFLCLFCIDSSPQTGSSCFPLSCNLSNVENYLTVLEPASLVSLLNSTVLLENIRGTELPSEKLSTTEMLCSGNFHLGLEEYLQAKINYLLEIIQLKDKTVNDEIKMSPIDGGGQQRQLGDNSLSVVKSVHEQFYQLCKCFTSCNYKDIILYSSDQ